MLCWVINRNSKYSVFLWLNTVSSTGILISPPHKTISKTGKINSLLINRSNSLQLLSLGDKFIRNVGLIFTPATNLSSVNMISGGASKAKNNNSISVDASESKQGRQESRRKKVKSLTCWKFYPLLDRIESALRCKETTHRLSGCLRWGFQPRRGLTMTRLLADPNKCDWPYLEIQIQWQNCNKGRFHSRRIHSHAKGMLSSAGHSGWTSNLVRWTR